MRKRNIKIKDCVFAIFIFYSTMKSDSNDVSKKYLEFEQLIQRIKERVRLNEKEICKALEKNEGYIAQLRSRYKKNHEEIPDSFINLLRLRFVIPEYNPKNIELSMANEDQEPIEKNIPRENHQSISSLIALNQGLVDAQNKAMDNQRLALEVNSKIADSNSRIAAALENLSNRTTADELERIVRDDRSKLFAIEQALVELGLKAKVYKTSEDGHYEIYKFFDAGQGKETLKSTVVESGKHDK